MIAVVAGGAGDAFRAGIVHGTLRGWPPPETVRFVSAAAALNCAAVRALLGSDADTRSRDP